MTKRNGRVSWPQTLERLYGVAFSSQRDAQAVFSVAGELCLDSAGKLGEKCLWGEDR